MNINTVLQAYYQPRAVQFHRQDILRVAVVADLRPFLKVTHLKFVRLTCGNDRDQAAAEQPLSDSYILVMAAEDFVHSIDGWQWKQSISLLGYHGERCIVLIKIDRESTSFAETFLICITHLSELCADAKGKAERLFSVGFASRDLLWHSEIRGLSFSLLLLYSGNFHGSFGQIEDCSENDSHFTSVLFS